MPLTVKYIFLVTSKQWYQQPDFDLFTPYFQRRKLYPEQAFYLLDPRSQWMLWDYIQSLIPVRIRKNPPSSGFLGNVLNLYSSYILPGNHSVG